MELTKNEEELNLREIIKPYVKKWHWFVIGFILSIIAAIIFIKFSKP